MILGLGSEVFEDALLPESLHQVPVFYHAVTDGVLAGVAYVVCFIAYVEVWREGGREGGGK